MALLLHPASSAHVEQDVLSTRCSISVFGTFLCSGMADAVVDSKQAFQFSLALCLGIGNAHIAQTPPVLVR